METLSFGRVTVMRSDGSEGGFVDITSDVLFGRDKTVDIRIKRETVSRQHARISIDENRNCSLIHLSKLNSTFLNGNIITGTQRLQNGDRISIGERQFVFQNDKSTLRKSFNAKQKLKDISLNTSRESVISCSGDMSLNISKDSLKQETVVVLSRKGLKSNRKLKRTSKRLFVEKVERTLRPEPKSVVVSFESVMSKPTSPPTLPSSELNNEMNSVSFNELEESNQHNLNVSSTYCPFILPCGSESANITTEIQKTKEQILQEQLDSVKAELEVLKKNEINRSEFRLQLERDINQNQYHYRGDRENCYDWCSDADRQPDGLSQSPQRQKSLTRRDSNVSDIDLNSAVYLARQATANEEETDDEVATDGPFVFRSTNLLVLMSISVLTVVAFKLLRNKI